MLDVISTETASRSTAPSESSDQPSRDAIETSNDFYAFGKNSESYQYRTLRQLERLWQQGSDNSSQP